MKPQENNQLNTSAATIAELNARLLDDLTPSELNINERYALLKTILLKTQARVTSMLNHCDANGLTQKKQQLLSQSAQLTGFIAAVECFSGTVDDDLIEIERRADLADRRKQLERSYVVRPAKRVAPQKAAPVFTGLSKEERIRLMQG